MSGPHCLWSYLVLRENQCRARAATGETMAVPEHPSSGALSFYAHGGQCNSETWRQMHCQSQTKTEHAADLAGSVFLHIREMYRLAKRKQRQESQLTLTMKITVWVFFQHIDSSCVFIHSDLYLWLWFQGNGFGVAGTYACMGACAHGEAESLTCQLLEWRFLLSGADCSAKVIKPKVGKAVFLQLLLLL